MRTETSIAAPTIEHVAEQARLLEDLGYDSLCFGEVAHDPFLPLVLIAEHAKSVRIGTGVAIAFPRSPFVTAQLSWDLQRLSRGRFNLGLGTQIKGDNEERYSTPWPSAPGPRLHEYIHCLRAIFNTFQTGAPPAFEGKHYRFTTIEGMFNPGPLENGRVPIYLAAVNRDICRLVGEMCDGIRMHPFNTHRYAREVIIPWIEEGAAKAGRKLSEIDIDVNVTLITGETEEQVEAAKGPIKGRIGYLGATRSYLMPVMKLHGWQEKEERLLRMASENKWQELAGQVTDEMLEEFAIVGTYDQVLPKIKERYAGVANTINVHLNTQTPEDRERARWLLGEIRKL